MLKKIVLLFTIIVCLTLILDIIKSRKRLWKDRNNRNSRIFTIRGIIIISVILLFLVFSLFR
ncbi:MAG: hypothetical protein V4581_13545 [Bacteroidota bacterium]